MMGPTGGKKRAFIKSPAKELCWNRNIATQIGYKCARAVKNWHGSWGFGMPGDDGCGSTYAATPNQTKYRSVYYSINTSTVQIFTYSSPAIGTNHTDTSSATITRKWTIDRYSGAKTTVTVSQTYSDITSFNNAAAWLGSFSSACGLINYSNQPTIAPWGSITPPISATTLQTDLNFSDSSTGSFGSYFNETSTGSASLSRTDLEIRQTYSSDQKTEDSAGNWSRVQTSFSLQISVIYSDPYLATDVHFDVDTLLTNASICAMPWRTDSQSGAGTFVQYNEGTKYLPETAILISDTVGTVTYASSLPDPTQPPAAVLVDRTNTIGVGSFPRGAFEAYTGDGGAPVVLSSLPVGQFCKGIWMEKKLDFLSFNWAAGSGTTATQGTYLIRQWTYDYRDIAITPSLRPNTTAFKDVACSQHNIGALKNILIAPSNYGCVSGGDFYTLPTGASFYLDPLGSYLQMDVAQVMFDPTLPYIPPLTNPVSLGNYNPIGAGAALIEAVDVQPGGPALPTNSRPLNNAAGFVAALNAVYPASATTAAPVNPEHYPTNLPPPGGETGQINDSAPWDHFP